MKKIYLPVLALVGIIGTSGLASAFGFGIADEGKTAIKQAIENNDFAAWKAAIAGTLTQENFDRIVERHIMMSKRMELKSAIRQAVEDRNYTAYKETVWNLTNSNRTATEEEFSAIVERFNATESGGEFAMHGFGHHRGMFGMHQKLW